MSKLNHPQYSSKPISRYPIQHIFDRRIPHISNPTPGALSLSALVHQDREAEIAINDLSDGEANSDVEAREGREPRRRESRSSDSTVSLDMKDIAGSKETILDISIEERDSYEGGLWLGRGDCSPSTRHPVGWMECSRKDFHEGEGGQCSRATSLLVALGGKVGSDRCILPSGLTKWDIPVDHEAHDPKWFDRTSSWITWENNIKSQLHPLTSPCRKLGLVVSQHKDFLDTLNSLPRQSPQFYDIIKYKPRSLPMNPLIKQSLHIDISPSSLVRQKANPRMIPLAIQSPSPSKTPRVKFVTPLQRSLFRSSEKVSKKSNPAPIRDSNTASHSKVLVEGGDGSEESEKSGDEDEDKGGIRGGFDVFPTPLEGDKDSYWSRFEFDEYRLAKGCLLREREVAYTLL